VVTLENKQFRISKESNYPGVYIILNLKNYKRYIGSSRNILKRLTEHEIALRKRRHHVKELQKDYDTGCKFIAYPLTEVYLLKRKYFVDRNLRYYEKEAIKIFDSTNPERGYNTILSCENQSEEFSNIYWKNVALECFIDVKEQRNCNKCSVKEKNKQVKEFKPLEIIQGLFC
jgi:hypothetical protein